MYVCMYVCNKQLEFVRDNMKRYADVERMSELSIKRGGQGVGHPAKKHEDEMTMRQIRLQENRTL